MGVSAEFGRHGLFQPEFDLQHVLARRDAQAVGDAEDMGVDLSLIHIYWRARFQALLPDMPIVVLGEPFDRRAVHYVASWKHPPGSLTGLPNLAAIFSLGAGVDFLFADDKLPEVPILSLIHILPVS